MWDNWPNCTHIAIGFVCCTVWIKNKTQLLGQLLAFIVLTIACYA